MVELKNRLSEIESTIEINRDRLKSNKELTNELLVDDLMLALGYNKKRNTNVKRLYNSTIDWEVILSNENKFAVITVGFGDDLEIDIESIIDSDYDFILVTNGIDIDVYKIDIKSDGRLIRISLFRDKGVLEHLTIENYSVDGIVSIYESLLLNRERAIKVLKDNIEYISNCILDIEGIGYEKSDENMNTLKDVILDVENRVKQDELIEQLNNDLCTLREKDNHNIKLQKELKRRVRTLIKDMNDYKDKNKINEDKVIELSEAKSNIIELTRELNMYKDTDERNLNKIKELRARDENNKKIIDELNSKLNDERNKDKQLDCTECPGEISIQDKNLEDKSTDGRIGVVEVEKSVKYTKLESENESNKKRIHELELELDTLKAGVSTDVGDYKKVEELSAENERYEKVIAELEIKIRALERNKNISKNGDEGDYIKRIEELEAEGQGRLEVIRDLTNKLNTIKDGGELDLDNIKDRRLRELEIENEKNMKLIHDLKTKLVTSSGSSIINIQNTEMEDRYQKTIIELKKRVEDLLTTKVNTDAYVKNLESQLEDIRNKPRTKHEETEDMAIDLLNSIKDDTTQNRSYVAVINAKIFQEKNINKFTGMCIEELYNAVRYKLMPILFDGDTFKLVQPSDRRDLAINSKYYDIDLGGLTEDEVLEKISTLFERFKEVVFMYKTIGKLDE